MFTNLALMTVSGALFVSSMLVIVWLFIWKRRRHSRPPFTEDLLSRPGEHVEKQLDEAFGNVAITYALISFGFIHLLLSVNFMHSPSWRLQAVLIVLGSIYGAFRMYRGFGEMANLRLGLLGERTTGMHLDRLMRQGAVVYHDVKLDDGTKSGGNVDHLVICRDVIFAVETKARSKPLRVQGADAFEKNAAGASVEYDGKALTFPNGVDTDMLKQTRDIAGHVSAVLKKKTGKRIRVIPVLALPGWKVDVKRSGKGSDLVLVINPKNTNFISKHLDRAIPLLPEIREAASIIKAASLSVNAKVIPWDAAASETHDAFLNRRYRAPGLGQ